MQGLLGNSMDDPRTMAVLQGVMGLLGARGNVQGVAQGLLGYQGAMQQAKQQAAVEQMRKMQLEQHAMQLETVRRAQAQQGLDQSLTQKAFMPISGGEANKASGLTGPTPQAAAVIGQRPAFDPLQFIAAGGSPDKAFAIAQAMRKETPKFSTAPQYDQQGRAFILAEDGTMKYLNGVSARDKLVSEDIGGQKMFRSEYSATPVATMKKTMSPDAAAANRVAWANVGLSQDRLNFDKENAGGVTYQTDGTGQIVALPKRPSLAGNITAIPVQGQGSQSKKDANEALALTSRIREILPNATGSMLGNGLDYALGAVGVSTEGADNASKLRALEGQLVAKMPKMSGPQSDKDAARYVQMAAEVGNANLPVARRLAALDEVEYFQRIYAGQGSLVSQPGKPSPVAALVFDPVTGTFK